MKTPKITNENAREYRLVMLELGEVGERLIKATDKTELDVIEEHRARLMRRAEDIIERIIIDTRTELDTKN